MTPADLRAWRTNMGITSQDKAAELLGMSSSNYKDLEGGVRRTSGAVIEQLDKRTALACAALAAGLREWSCACHN
jgi:predicted transcriptional regulator